MKNAENISIEDSEEGNAEDVIPKKLRTCRRMVRKECEMSIGGMVFHNSTILLK